MSNHKPQIDEVRATINALIEAGTSFDIAALDRIYHDQLTVLSFDTSDDNSGEVNKANKEAFKGLFKAKLEAGAEPLNTWADYHFIEADDEKAHVLISRKVNLVDQEQLLTLSIDLVYQDTRWQVIREVIFARPLTS